MVKSIFKSIDVFAGTDLRASRHILSRWGKNVSSALPQCLRRACFETACKGSVRRDPCLSVLTLAWCTPCGCNPSLLGRSRAPAPTGTVGGFHPGSTVDGNASRHGLCTGVAPCSLSARMISRFTQRYPRLVPFLSSTGRPKGLASRRGAIFLSARRKKDRGARYADHVL